MTGGGRSGKRSLIAFAAVTSLFFAWGFITSNNDPLIVALRAAFHLNYTEALLTQIVFFLAYGLLSLPSAWLASRLGPVDTILLALALMVCGCLLVVASTALSAFAPILGALFVLAAGFTALQVAANPLAADLGPLERSHFRLNLAQAFNSLGVVIGVHFGSVVMLGGSVPGSGGAPGAAPAAILAAVDRAFLTMAAMLALLLLMFALLRRFLASAAAPRAPSPAGMFDALHSRWAVFGAVAIGLYVGAEVSIGSIMINFLNQPAVLGLPLEEAGAHLANFYWGGALAGRIVGTLLLTKVRAAPLLAACAAAAALLCIAVVTADGAVAGYSALAVGLFNSIMFPTIFSLTLERSGVAQSATSGLLCLAIFGGALLPFGVGMVADAFGLGAAFLIPLVAYLFIGLFAAAAHSGRPARRVNDPSTLISPLP